MLTVIMILLGIAVLLLLDGILENHFPKVKPTHVILQYGTPIYLDQLSADDRKYLATYTQNTVHELLADNRKYL